MSKKESASHAKSRWDFPTEGVSVEAESYEDALAQLEKIKSSTPEVPEAIVSPESEK